MTPPCGLSLPDAASPAGLPLAWALRTDPHAEQGEGQVAYLGPSSLLFWGAGAPCCG